MQLIDNFNKGVITLIYSDYFDNLDNEILNKFRKYF
jgi:hypothetical protein